MGNDTEKVQTHEAAISAPVGQGELQDQRQKVFAEQMKQIMWLHRHGDEYRARLLQNIKQALPKLEKLLADLEFEEATEDGVYRFYDGSYKVYGLQNATALIVNALKELLPDRPLNASFTRIVAEGTGHDFKDENDQNWFPTTRAILEAFFHAQYFLEMACKYGRELDQPPDAMPSGWAAVLYLYNLG